MALLPNLQRTPQWLRFLVVGGFAALLNWLVRYPLSLVLPFWLAVTVASLIGMIFGFIAYNLLVFAGSTRGIYHRLRDFVLVNAAGLLATTAVAVTIASAAASVCVPVLGIAGVAHALGIAVGAFVNYFGHRTMTFR